MKRVKEFLNTKIGDESTIIMPVWCYLLGVICAIAPVMLVATGVF